MTTANFIQSVDNIYWPLGGYSGASSVISESEMADAVLFNGLTWYASPLYTADGPYLLFDLAGLGYSAGQLYRVFNSDFKFIYSARAFPLENTSEIYYGNLDIEKEFLESTSHGSRYFFLFTSPTGPQLSQFIVNHSADEQVSQGYIKDLISKNSITQAKSHLNEAFVTGPPAFNIHTLQATIDTVSNYNNLVKHPDCISLFGLNTYAYFQPKHDTWVTFTDDQGQPLYFDTVDGINNWANKVVTDEDGHQLLFIEARPRLYNTPLSRTLDGLGTPLAINFSSAKLTIQISLTTTAPS